MNHGALGPLFSEKNALCHFCVEPSADTVQSSPTPHPANQSSAKRGFSSCRTTSQKEAYAFPVVARDKSGSLFHPRDDIRRYVASELDVSRLDSINKRLWLAGRPMSARPLHRQTMMDRQFKITEQTDLHLVWSGSWIFVKPLPKFLMDYCFWKSHVCSEEHTYSQACGLLLSYIWLVSAESDFRIAIGLGLLPDALTWDRWIAFVDDIWSRLDAHSLHQVSRRYQYGELRLNRLNLIYRLDPQFRLKYFFRGYHDVYHEYSDFFRRNFTWPLIGIIYITIVLTAMQVGLATSRLQPSEMFQNAAYGFTVFAIAAPMIVVAFALCTFATLFCYNFLATLAFTKKTEAERQIRIRARDTSGPPAVDA